MAMPRFARRCKRLAPLLAAPAALLLNLGESKAVLTYNIFESGGNVVVQTSGSLNLTGSQTTGNAFCGANGAILSSIGAICTGTDPGSEQQALSISGPGDFNGSANFFFQRTASLEYLLFCGVIIAN